MDAHSEDPRLIEGTYTFEARDGIMYVIRNGETRVCMRMCVFTQLIAGGTRALKAWHEAEAARRPIKLFAGRKRAH